MCELKVKHIPCFFMIKMSVTEQILNGDCFSHSPFATKCQEIEHAICKLLSIFIYHRN